MKIKMERCKEMEVLQIYCKKIYFLCFDLILKYATMFYVHYFSQIILGKHNLQHKILYAEYCDQRLRWIFLLSIKMTQRIIKKSVIM